jgi:hypothetical protein
LTDYGGKSLASLLILSQVVNGKRQSMPAIPAEHRLITGDTDWGTLCQEFNRPIVVVENNPRYVNFWRNVCGDGMDFASLVEAGGKRFGSPWAMLGFKGLLKALVVSEAEPDQDDLEFLEMQEALEAYIKHHGLFAQAVAASRLASRLPWLVKYKFVDTMPQPIHSADLVPGRKTRNGSLPTADITFKLPPRFTIGTLLIAGHLMETRFNHWVSENMDLETAYTSLGAAYRKLFYLWETGSRTATPPWGVSGMKEVHEVGEFLGHILYSKRGDLKFRGPGLNTSFWEAAIAGPIPGTAAHAVLSAQQPNTSVVGATIISVGAGWFAKVRASDLFGNRLFDRPYNDFPFPSEKIPATYLSETEQRVALTQKPLPSFELTELHFGRNRPISSYQQLLLPLAPVFPPGGGMHTGGRFRETYISQGERTTGTQSNIGGRNSTDSRSELGAVCAGGQASVQTVLSGWESIDRPVGGEIVPVSEGKDSAFRAFVDALRASGMAADFETVNDVARNHGWDGETLANMRDLGHLCEHFAVGLRLEHELTGCLRYRMACDRPQIRLVYLENRRFGWVREKTEKAKDDANRKLVRFPDNEVP